MVVVGKKGDIKKIEWEFKGQHYRITSTQSTGSYRPVWEAVDTVKRSDGTIKKFTRKELKEYFNTNNYGK